MGKRYLEKHITRIIFVLKRNFEKDCSEKISPPVCGGVGVRNEIRKKGDIFCFFFLTIPVRNIELRKYYIDHGKNMFKEEILRFSTILK